MLGFILGYMLGAHDSESGSPKKPPITKYSSQELNHHSADDNSGSIISESKLIYDMCVPCKECGIMPDVLEQQMYFQIRCPKCGKNTGTGRPDPLDDKDAWNELN